MVYFTFVSTFFTFCPTGFHAGSDFAHLMDVPHTRPKQEAGYDSFHDFFRCCSGFTRGNEIQPYGIPLPSLCSRCEYHELLRSGDSKYSSQFEASRLVMIQILLHNLKMDPLVSLHYYAPVCAAINVVILPFTEGLAPFYELKNVGFAIFLSNALVAFLLNVAAVFLVGVASGLVLTLAGVFKVSLCRFEISF